MVKGFDVVYKNLKKLDDRQQRLAFRNATRKSAGVISKKAKQLVPVQSGDLKRAIGVVFVKRYTTANQTVYAVTTRRGKKFGGWYGHIVEFGYGRQTPQPFLRPAIEQSKQEVLRVTREELWNQIQKRIK